MITLLWMQKQVTIQKTCNAKLNTIQTLLKIGCKWNTVEMGNYSSFDVFHNNAQTNMKSTFTHIHTWPECPIAAKSTQLKVIGIFLLSLFQILAATVIQPQHKFFSLWKICHCKAASVLKINWERLAFPG